MPHPSAQTQSVSAPPPSHQTTFTPPSGAVFNAPAKPTMLRPSLLSSTPLDPEIPAWYRVAITSLDASMKAAANATGFKTTWLSDVFYLRKLASALHVWEQTLLMYASTLVPPAKPSSKRRLS